MAKIKSPAILRKWIECRVGVKIMTTVEEKGIPVRTVPKDAMLAEVETRLRKYEKRYEMSSEKMAALLELDAIRPTAEVLRWYSAYQGAKLLRAKTPTTGIPGTTTEASTNSG